MLLLLALASCATSEINLNTPEGLFKAAKNFEQNERYESAIAKYSELKNKFPLSSLAIEAELSVADLNYKKESYLEAQIAYQNFRDLHPKHPKMDYVIYQLAMSYYQQVPEDIDRDLTLANDAIYHFSEVIKLFPQSTWAADAKLKKAEAFKKLAEKELYIAHFYFKNRNYRSAIKRYENLLSKYPDTGYDENAKTQIALAKEKLSEYPEEGEFKK